MSGAAAAGGDFKFPPYFEWPPFFTLQPTLATRQRQLALWSDLVRAYCAKYNISVLEVAKAASLPLFNNPRINRRLSPEGIDAVFADLVSQGFAEWLTPARDRLLVMWRKPEEWAAVIADWVQSTHSSGGVFTLYELANGDDTRDAPFRGLDLAVLKRALAVLESQGRAALFPSGDGVKFA